MAQDMRLHEWKTWRGYVAGDKDEDLVSVFTKVRRDGMESTQMKWKRDWRTRTFCDLALHLLYEEHIQRAPAEGACDTKLFANVKASDLQKAAMESGFFEMDDAEELNVDRFNKIWGQQDAFCQDLISYLFRPSPYLRRIDEQRPQLIAAAAAMTLGQWIRHTATTELTSAQNNPLVALHTLVETLRPNTPSVQRNVHQLRQLRLQRWADLYQIVFTAYGAPIRPGREDLDWLDVAERFSTMAGGAIVRSQTRGTKTRSTVDAELLGQLVIELLPALLDIRADDIDTRKLVTPINPG